MRKILVLTIAGLLTLALVSGAAYAQGYWELIYSQSMAMNSGFMKIDAADRDNVYIAGLHQDGALSAVYGWRSNNGGRTVTPMYRIEMDPNDPCSMMDMMGFLLDVQFPTANHGVLVGMGVPEECKELGMPACMACIFMLQAKVLYTYDGGDTWSEAPLPGQITFKILQTAEFVSDTVGYAAGAPAYIIKTTDGGFNWVELDPPGGNENLGINELYFLDENHGWMSTGDLDPEEPESDAQNDPDAWYEAVSERINYIHNPLYRLQWKLDHDGKGKGMNGVLYHTDDGGLSWESINTAGQESYLASFFVTPEKGFVLADPLAGTTNDMFRLYMTDDGGDSWQRVTNLPASVPGGTAYIIQALYFTDEDNGWAFGAAAGGLFYKSVILQTTDGGESWVADPFCGTASHPLLAADFVDKKTGFAAGMYLGLAGYVGPNTLPIADAGLDQEVALGDIVTLDGSGSSDADGDELSFIWSQPAGPLAEMDDTTIMQPTFEATELGELTFELVVSDGEGLSEPDQCTVLVTEEGPVEDDDDDTGGDDDDDDDDDDDGCGGCGVL